MTEKPKQHISQAERKAYALIGSVGGKASFKARGKKGMSDMGKKGAAKRWRKSPKKIGEGAGRRSDSKPD